MSDTIASGGNLANPPPRPRRFDTGASRTLDAGRPKRKDGTGTSALLRSTEARWTCTKPRSRNLGRV